MAKASGLQGNVVGRPSNWHAHRALSIADQQSVAATSLESLVWSLMLRRSGDWVRDYRAFRIALR